MCKLNQTKENDEISQEDELCELLLRKSNVMNSISKINQYNNFSEFFDLNYEFLKPKKIYIGTWNGWDFKKDYNFLFDLSIQSLIKMQFIDLKHGTFEIQPTVLKAPSIE